MKWTILRSFRATWVTLPDCIGGVTWQHILPGRFLQIDYTQFDRLNLCCQVQDNFELWSMQSAYRDIQYDTLYTLYDVHWCASAQVKKARGRKNEKFKTRKKVCFEEKELIIWYVQILEKKRERRSKSMFCLWMLDNVVKEKLQFTNLLK